jgi:hypothetical protein
MPRSLRRRGCAAVGAALQPVARQRLRGASARRRAHLLDRVGDLGDAGVHALEAEPMAENASRVRAAVATPSSVRLAPSPTTPTARAVSPWISAISDEIWWQ